jgi:hypothetical protein
MQQGERKCPVFVWKSLEFVCLDAIGFSVFDPPPSYVAQPIFDGMCFSYPQSKCALPNVAKPC